MTVRQRLVTSDEGRPLLVKSAPAGPDADRLAHEGALLRLAAHPGVVTVVAEHEAADGGRELHLAVAGSRSAADLEPDLVGIAGMVAALATTVADLHDLGVVHGRIAADHVVVDRDGRPVLCGLAGAAPIGVVPLGGTVPLEPADDVHAIGRLLARLLDRGAAADDGRRTWGWRPTGGRVEAALRAVVEAATATDPADRPSAREIGVAILAAVPAARLPEDGAAADPSRPAGRWAGVLAWLGLDEQAGIHDGERRRPLTLVAAPADPPVEPERSERRHPLIPILAVVGLGLLAFGVGGLLRPSGPVSSPPATTATTATTAPGADPVAEPIPSVGSAAAGVLEVDGARYAVGDAGDVLAVGDWDCDGTATVAVLRPATGEVFVFRDWATADHRATAMLAAEVPGAATAAGVDPDGDGCPTLVVTDAAGTPTEVPT